MAKKTNHTTSFVAALVPIDSVEGAKRRKISYLFPKRTSPSWAGLDTLPHTRAARISPPFALRTKALPHDS